MAAIIETKPGRYFSAIAFVYGDEDRDWLASVYREPDGSWHMDYRFRYYADDDPFSTNDRKSAYESTITGHSEQSICASVRACAEELVKRGFNTKVDWLEIGSADPQVVMRRLASRPWAHIKMVKDMPS